jgi:hypothetical protein
LTAAEASAGLLALKRFRAGPHYTFRSKFRMHEVLDPLSRFSRMESLLRAGRMGVEIMSLMEMIIAVGWVVTFAMIGWYALKESGKLSEIRERIAAWRKTSGLPDAGMSADDVDSVDENVA